MSVHVYHGTNTVLYDRMTERGKIETFRDPLLEKMRQAAIARGSDYRTTLLRRSPNIYVSSTANGAETYSWFSPEMLITSLNILIETDLSLAKTFIQNLLEQQWSSIRPLVLKIRVENPSELGFDLPQLDQPMVEALAGSTNELILRPLPFERVEEIAFVNEPHMLENAIRRAGC